MNKDSMSIFIGDGIQQLIIPLGWREASQLNRLEEAARVEMEQRIRDYIKLVIRDYDGGTHR